MEALTYAPIAFGLYVVLVAVLSGMARNLASAARPTALKSSSYASGEAAPGSPNAPGYRQFFTVALFFAVLHLGVLMAGSGGLTLVNAAYLGGLILALVALILG
jgi:NADH:ubiquinone oxidoreductase subunit 3 (subunit A)